MTQGIPENRFGHALSWCTATISHIIALYSHTDQLTNVTWSHWVCLYRKEDFFIYTKNFLDTAIFENMAIHLILPGKTKEVTDELLSHDREVHSMHARIVSFGLLGDYRVSAEFVDVKKLSVQAPCSHCTFCIKSRRVSLLSPALHQCTPDTRHFEEECLEHLRSMAQH